MGIDFSKYKKQDSELPPIDFSKYRKREVGGTAAQVSHGIAASGFGMLRGVAKFGQGVLDQTGGRVANLLSGKGFTPTNSVEDTAETSGVFGDEFGRYLQPQTGTEQGFKLGADILSYFMPAGAVNRATQGASVVPRVLARTAPDVGIATAQSLGENQTPGEAGTVAGVTGITSAVGNALLPGKPMNILNTIGRGAATGYTADVATGLTGMRGEENKGYDALMPSWGTALGTGVGAVSAAPQIRNKLTVTQHVDQLEQKYSDIFHAWKGISKKSDKAAKVTVMKNRSGTTGRTPERVLAEGGIIPKLDGDKFSTTQQAEQLRQSTQKLREANRAALQEASYSTRPVLIDDLEREAIRRARSDKNIASGKSKRLENRIKSEMDDYRENYGDSVSLLQLDDIKSARWAEANFGLTADDKLLADVNYIIGKSGQHHIETTAMKAGAGDVAQLNRTIGDTMEAAKFLDNINGNKVLYGRMGTHMMRIGGAIVGSGGGPLGSVAGMLGGNVMAGILRSLHISTPVKRLILNNLKKTDPAEYKRTLEWLKK